MRKKIEIERTERTPEVLFDIENNIFSMKYDSRPEDVRRFYYPLIESIKEAFDEIYKTNNLSYFSQNPFVFEFKLGYFNSSSAKFILDILTIAEEYKKKGINIIVKWYYLEDDEDMLEAGEDFAEFSEMEFEFISMSDDEYLM